MGFRRFVRDVITGQGRRINVALLRKRFRWTGFIRKESMSRTWVNFKPEEIEGLDNELVAKLDWARSRSGVEFFITSGKRTPEHNKAVGGVDKSSHVKGLAVDLRVPNSQARYKMIQSLLLAGFRRVGVYPAHLHADIDPELPQDVIWLGESH